MKVLFCTEGSEASFYAIEKTLPFLKADYQIDMISVMDFGFFPTYVTFPHEEEDGFPGQNSIAEKILNKTREIIESKGFKITNSTYAAGKPADIIINTIESDGYDIVVLGSHGKKGFRGWLGSVSRKVVTRSPIPTLIARPPKIRETIIKNNTKNILISTDGSECSYNAIRKIIDILNLDNSNIEILTVRPGLESLPVEITMDNEWLENSLAKQEEIAKEILQTAQKILGDNSLKAQKAFSLEGDPADQIIKYTDENPKDLIVMGSHGREGIADMLLGSVSKRVLDHAASPVLIVPSKRKPHKV